MGSGSYQDYFVAVDRVEAVAGNTDAWLQFSPTDPPAQRELMERP